MTPLERLIRAQIAAEGPISTAAYMALCLGHPEHGYYMRRDPLGRAGDFVTAPEISQMFGEMVGLWCAAAWASAGRPEGVRLVELGPGRGTLMTDARRAMAAAGLRAETWFVETSPALRAEQAARHPEARWADRLEAVPAGPMLLIANEFFDALPVRQFIASPEGWRERVLGLAEGRLAWGLSPVLPGGPGAAPGAWVERSAAAEEVADAIAARLRADGGAALVIDYGYDRPRPPGWTLQAVRAHARVDALESPGEADLTWLIDFPALAARFSGLEVRHGTQGAFLAAMGIGARAAALAGRRPDRAAEIAEALERLTAPERMGRLFRVLGIRAPGWAAAGPPPGFPGPTAEERP
ncbi:SAM-dependent methyltransferase [Paralimibaculum aggregatum]|uniref:SAM-dependent methyltransferase n=1 Tax=Paralimibaculum aggregatum TaxID=3036245 RepID=A0ABQ6LKB1_9RHOB|nr:SAM-dependent methyltransferase [Limibaculum sp. NKW23]GMG83687.1 SAM-dependent methyltransferase [Limibaculum sp. NKW23]